MARGYRPGRTAKSILKRVGDIDVSQVGPEGRARVLDSFEEVAITDVKTASKAATRRLRTKLAVVDQRIEDRARRRQAKNELRKDRVEQGRLWRATGIYEKTTHIDLPHLARVLVYAFLAGLDFYVFAEAWAIGTDARAGEAIWWVGGLFGLVVFVAGFLAAVQAKRILVARKQRELLEEVEQPDPRLVVLSPNMELFHVAAALFVVMILLGFGVRIANDEGNMFMVMMAALVPAIAVVAELFLHDPMSREEVNPNLIDRLLNRRKARLERKLQIVEEKIASALEQIRAMYETDRRILDVEQHDLGIRAQEAS